MSDPPPEPRSGDAATALVHLYRAEVGRLTAYRARLDTTTNWAITSTGLVATFALGQARITHVAFLFLMFTNAFFLDLEAHRYRLFRVSRERVTLLEQGFYGELLGAPPRPGWPEELVTALREPDPPDPYLSALGVRLRRNYLVVFAAVLLTWLVKLDVSGSGGAGLPGIVERARVGPVTGGLVLSAVALFYLGLFSLAVWSARREPAEVV